MITLVVSVTDEEIFEKCLLASLKKQSVKYKLIQTDPELTLSQSYNTVENIETKYVAFIHQDTIFKEKGDWLKKAEHFAENLGDFGVCGYAGWTANGKLKTYILVYAPNTRKPHHWIKERNYANEKLRGRILGRPFRQPKEVQVVDDSFFLLRRKIWDKMKFNEDFPFHMFAFDYCLTLKYDLGLKNYSLPLKTYEWAVLSWSEEYFEKHGKVKEWREKLLKKWKDRIKRIQGWDTRTKKRIY